MYLLLTFNLIFYEVWFYLNYPNKDHERYIYFIMSL